MNPIPISSIVCLTASGSRSILIPRASSTSELPDIEVAARFPCLATRTPAAAVTIAAAVEILIVLRPSPPVPQVSTSLKDVLGRIVFPAFFIPLTKPAISSGFSPFALRASRNLPISSSCAVLRILPTASSASSELRSQPSSSF